MSQRRENRGRWVGVMQTTSVPGKEQLRKGIDKIKPLKKEATWVMYKLGH